MHVLVVTRMLLSTALPRKVTIRQDVDYVETYEKRRNLDPDTMASKLKPIKEHVSDPDNNKTTKRKRNSTHQSPITYRIHLQAERQNFFTIIPNPDEQSKIRYWKDVNENDKNHIKNHIKNQYYSYAQCQARKTWQSKNTGRKL